MRFIICSVAWGDA